MALKNYHLRPPSTVILADRRDPYVSWQNHLNRTSGQRGGVDIVAAIGTPIYARTAGRMIQLPNDGSAGNSCRFYHRDNTGWKDVFSHLSSYRTPKNPQGLNAFDYEAGDIVAYTGNTGGVTQHLHWHLLDPNSVRRNPWDYFSGSTPVGGGTTPIPNPIPIEEIMALKGAHTIYYNKDRGYVLLGPFNVYDIGDSDGVSGQDKLNALTAAGVEIPIETVDTRTWDILKLIFKGNHAARDNAKYTASLVQPTLTAENLQAVVDGVIAGIGSDLEISAEKLQAAMSGLRILPE